MGEKNPNTTLIMDQPCMVYGPLLSRPSRREFLREHKISLVALIDLEKSQQQTLVEDTERGAQAASSENANHVCPWGQSLLEVELLGCWLTFPRISSQTEQGELQSAAPHGDADLGGIFPSRNTNSVLPSQGDTLVRAAPAGESLWLQQHHCTEQLLHIFVVIQFCTRLWFNQTIFEV